MEIPCKECGGNIEVSAPRLELINQFSVSMIVWAHPDAPTCAKCGATVVGAIPEMNAENFKLVYMPLPAESRPANIGVAKPKSNIILPFGR
jgi:rRNA maturation protein Nop10